MVKLNRATEYGLIALRYIRNKGNGELTSAREISKEYNLPFEILAKTLQKLKEQGIIGSTFGTRGGYQLSKDLTKLSLLEFLQVMEGNIGVVSCVESSNQSESSANCCSYESSCSIRPVMSSLNTKIYDFLSRISLDELTRTSILEETKASSAEVSGNSLPIRFELSGDEP